MNKSLTISIEDPDVQNEEEIHLSQLTFALNEIKVEQSPTLITSIHEKYKAEKTKLSSVNNTYLSHLLNYMEGETNILNLPYSWLQRNMDINNLTKCIFLSPKGNESIIKKDFSLEFKVLKLLTEKAFNKNRLITLPRSLKCNNRYADITPYENNTAPYAFLDKYDQSNQNEWYINASFVDGPLREDQKIFIATQGPLMSTVGKFYHMCFSHNTKLIIMLNSVEEEGRKKCEKYFPDSIEGKCFFTLSNDIDIEVTLKNEEWLIPNCLIKKILLIKIKEETKAINHIQMVNWSDHCAPDEITGFEAINTIIHSIIEYRDQFPSSPVVIHCSAGIGRTGTLIAIFNLIKCLLVYKTISPIELVSKPKAFLSVFNVVRILREQRIGMVTSLDQYKYIYQFVFEWFARNIEITG